MIPSLLETLCAFSRIANLPFKGFKHLVFKTQLVFDLVYISLMSLLSITKLILKTFNLFVFILRFFKHPSF